MDIFEEVKADLEREHYARLWDRYGYALLLAIVAIIIATSLGVWWKGHVVQNQELMGNMFGKAIIAANKNATDEALTTFTALAGKGEGDIAFLALMRKAALLSDQGKVDEAITLYDTLSTEKKGNRPLKELSILLASYLRIETGKPVNDNVFDSLTKEDSVWRSSGMELKAVNALKKGHYTQAKEIFSTLAKGDETPSAMKARAADMVTALE